MIEFEVTQISDSVVKELTDFQKMIHILFDAHENKMADTRDYKALKNQLRPFMNYSWYKLVADVIARQNEKLVQLTQDKRITKKTTIDHITQVNQAAIKSFRAGDTQSIKKAGALLAQYVPAFQRVTNRNFQFDNIVRNPAKKGATWGGGGFSTELVSSFTKDQAEKVTNIDLNSPQYSYIEYPHGTTDLYDVIYFMQNLQTTDDAAEVDGKKALRYMQLSTSKDQVAEFNKHMEKYLRENSKKSLAYIVKAVNELPLLKALNDKAKDTILGNKLYRGVGLDEDDEDHFEETVRNNELARDSIATSTSMRAAENFAHKRGHLEGSTSRVDTAYLIVYVPSREDILMMLDIFGSIYGESEIIIKPTEDNLKEILDITIEDDYEDDYNDDY